LIAGFTSEGQISVDVSGVATNFSYTYGQHPFNKNFRTLQNFSLDAKDTMRGPDDSYYPEYQAFLDYYGDADYANKFIVAAFNKVNTGFSKG
jgi:hypothetical protein